MHIRVLLSKYRSYTPCPACGGARLKTESLLWRVGGERSADAVLAPDAALPAAGRGWSRRSSKALPGLCLHDLMLLPIERLRRFFPRHRPVDPGVRCTQQLPGAGCKNAALRPCAAARRNRHPPAVPVRRRHRLPHARPAKPHSSGGEVQRINLTTALGTSPGQHPVRARRAQHRPAPARHAAASTEAMQRLHDAGNTLVVVEHDPAVMLGRRPRHRPGPRPRRTRRADRVRRHAGRAAPGRYADRRVPGRAQADRLGLQAPVHETTPRLILEGARQHNLRGHAAWSFRCSAW